MAPAEPDTMLTVIVELQYLTNMTRHIYTIFTNDQQLYHVVANMTLVYPDCFQLHTKTGRHTYLMNFTRAVGTLMTDTGLETGSIWCVIWKVTFSRTFRHYVWSLKNYHEGLSYGW